MKTFDQTEISLEYNPHAKSEFELVNDMWVDRGTKEDWNKLHDLHYKAESVPPGPHFWRCTTGDGKLVGITVLNIPSLLLSSRHEVFPKLKPGGDTHFTNVHRAAWINDNMRRAGRIVTDTLFRGLGISYRMVNLAMRMEGVRFVEIQSSMSKYNPFDKKAGFVHCKLKNAALYERGIAFLRSYFKSHPADHESILKELKIYPESMRKIIIDDMRDFYYRNSSKEKTGKNLNIGTRKVDIMSDSKLLRELQQLIFAVPAYGIWTNPDLGRDIPDKLPLCAFDWQGPNEPLNLEKLREYYEANK